MAWNAGSACRAVLTVMDEIAKEAAAFDVMASRTRWAHTTAESDMSGSSKTRRWITCLVLSGLLVGQRALAQEATRLRSDEESGQWTLVNAIGYGGVGFLAGIAAASDQEIGAAAGTIALGSIVGVAAGVAVGRRASSRIRAGEPLGGASRFAVSAGTILAGATLGACAAVPLINGEGAGTPLGSDESTLGILMGTGTLLSAWYLRRHIDEFNGRQVGIAPIRTIDSAYGLRVSVRY